MKTITVTKAAKAAPASKPAAKVDAKPVAKAVSKAVKIDKATPLGALAAALGAMTELPPVTTAKKKLTRDERFPTEAKKAAEKTEAAAKPKVEKVAKVAKEQVAFVARVMPKDGKLFAITERGRPQNGSMLFAHTHAVLTFFGLLDAKRPVVPASTVRSMMGKTAVTYHTAKQNFEETADGGLRLSEVGLMEFNKRMSTGKIDVKAANAFCALFADGTLSADIGTKQHEVYSTKF